MIWSSSKPPSHGDLNIHCGEALRWFEVLEICISINQIFGWLKNCKFLYFMIKPLNEMIWDDLKFIPQRHLFTKTLWGKASNSVILELFKYIKRSYPYFWSVYARNVLFSFSKNIMGYPSFQRIWHHNR
jgi:hypothetical protein